MHGSPTGSSRPWSGSKLRCLSWEDVIEVVAFHDPESGQLHRQLLREVPPVQPTAGSRWRRSRAGGAGRTGRSRRSDRGGQ